MVFTAIFTLECIFKIVLMGFVRHKSAYLKDTWNIFDFSIVIISLVNILPFADQESLKSLRTVRILRPLRSIGALKSMKILIQTMFKSIPGLFNVCVFLTFMFSIFAILGVHSFAGHHYKFCRMTEEIIDDGVNPPVWPINPDADWLCSNDQMCSAYPNYLGNDVVAKCGDVYIDYELDPVEVDKTRDIEMIDYDLNNFNNVMNAGLTIFQIVTLEGWAKLLYNYMDSSGSFTAIIFFILVVILGSFISLNLVLAQIMHSFIEE